jgi:hypothetical protein
MTAILRAAEAIALAAVTRQYQTGSQQLTVALLGTCAVLTLAAAVGAVCGAVYRLVAGTPQQPAEVYTPTRAPLWPSSTADEVFEAYDAEHHAAAMAAVAAEPMQQPIRDGAAVIPTMGPHSIRDTAVMPVVQTTPTFGFGPCRVVDAPPVAWMAPVATAVPTAAGRHAGAAAALDDTAVMAAVGGAAR